MIVERSESENRKLHIDLKGEEGNAFALLGLAKELCEKCGLSKKESDEMQEDMMSGDYENLINIFDGVFGDLIVFYR